MKAATPSNNDGVAETAPKRQKASLQKNAAEDASAIMMDEDSRQAFHLKLSKWANGAFHAVRCSIFWLMLRVEHQVRSPLAYFFCWCQKHSNDELLLKLVTHQADDILKRFDVLAGEFNTWFDAAVAEMKAQDLPKEFFALFRSYAFKQLVSAAGNFQLQVVAAARRHRAVPVGTLHVGLLV